MRSVPRVQPGQIWRRRDDGGLVYVCEVRSAAGPVIIYSCDDDGNRRVTSRKTNTTGSTTTRAARKSAQIHRFGSDYIFVRVLPTTVNESKVDVLLVALRTYQKQAVRNALEYLLEAARK